MGKFYTQEEKDIIFSMRSQGHTCKEISLHVDRTPEQIQNFIERHGGPRVYARWSKIWEKVLVFEKQGLRQGEIAERLGVTLNALKTKRCRS